MFRQKQVELAKLRKEHEKNKHKVELVVKHHILPNDTIIVEDSNQLLLAFSFSKVLPASQKLIYKDMNDRLLLTAPLDEQVHVGHSLVRPSPWLSSLGEFGWTSPRFFCRSHPFQVCGMNGFGSWALAHDVYRQFTASGLQDYTKFIFRLLVDGNGTAKLQGLYRRLGFVNAVAYKKKRNGSVGDQVLEREMVMVLTGDGMTTLFNMGWLSPHLKNSDQPKTPYFGDRAGPSTLKAIREREALEKEAHLETKDETTEEEAEKPKVVKRKTAERTPRQKPKEERSAALAEEEEKKIETKKVEDKKTQLKKGVEKKVEEHTPLRKRPEEMRIEEKAVDKQVIVEATDEADLSGEGREGFAISGVTFQPEQINLLMFEATRLTLIPSLQNLKVVHFTALFRVPGFEGSFQGILHGIDHSDLLEHVVSIRMANVALRASPNSLLLGSQKPKHLFISPLVMSNYAPLLEAHSECPTTVCFLSLAP